MDPTITLLQLALHYRPTPLQLLYLNLCVCLSNTACAMSGYPSCNGCQQYLLHADSWRHASVSAWHRWWLNTVVKCQKRLSPGHDRVIDPWELLHSYAIYWFGLIRCKIVLIYLSKEHDSQVRFDCTSGLLSYSETSEFLQHGKQNIDPRL